MKKRLTFVQPDDTEVWFSTDCMFSNAKLRKIKDQLKKEKHAPVTFSDFTQELEKRGYHVYEEKTRKGTKI